MFATRRIFACALLAASVGVAAEPGKRVIDYGSQLRAARKLLELPEAAIDLAKVKVEVDQMIDPMADPVAVLAELDRMAADIKSTFPSHASSLQRFTALRDYLFRPPLLSGRKPFRYDFEDDMNPRSKLMSVYLATHKGNCVSMPMLLIILGQKLGVPVTATAAPAHLYVKFRADNGVWHGVEATNGGGWADDDWQRSQFPRMTQTAIDNGLYMRPLSQRETVAVIVEQLLEFYENQHTLAAEEARVALALLMMKHHPTEIVAMVHAYLGMREIRQRLFVNKYPRPSDIPPELRGEFLRIEHESMYWGNKAKALGYMGSTPEMDAAYREKIKRAKAQNGIQ